MEQIEINGLLWDTENLEIQGKKYFTWQEAMDAAKSEGKRLPTKEELQALFDAGWEWDEEKKGMWFADRKLFFPAEGNLHYSNGGLYNQGSHVFVWSSSPNGDSNAYNLNGYSGDAYVNYYFRSYGFAVRCVQDIQSDNSTIKGNNMEKVYSQWKNASFEPPIDMQIVFVKTKCKSLLAGFGVGYKLPGRMAFEVEGKIISYDGNDVNYYDVFWTEVPK